MDRVLAYHELLIRLKQWCRLFEIWTTGRTIFSTAEVISTNEVFKYPLAEIPRSCRYFLSSAHSLRRNQLYFCDLPFLNLTLFEGCSEFRRISHLRYLRLKKSVHLSAKVNHTQIRNSVWEFRLPHVLQRFVGTNFLTEVILFNNLLT